MTWKLIISTYKNIPCFFEWATSRNIHKPASTSQANDTRLWSRRMVSSSTGMECNCNFGASVVAAETAESGLCKAGSDFSGGNDKLVIGDSSGWWLSASSWVDVVGNMGVVNCMPGDVDAGATRLRDVRTARVCFDSFFRKNCRRIVAKHPLWLLSRTSHGQESRCQRTCYFSLYLELLSPIG